VVRLVLKRSEKEQVITELHDKMAKAKVAIVTAPKNIDVATVTELRKKFRAQKVEYKVIKNTLAKLAAKGTASEVISDLMVGPTALVLGYEDVVMPAKVLQEFVEKTKAEKLSIKGAVLDGKKLDAKAVEALSKLPGLPELRSMLLGLCMRPAQQLVSVMTQPAAGLARVLEAKSKKG
jgi:large subunit ribosomal protein L10